MTTYYDFNPSTTAPFQFQPILDGTPYNVTVTWSFFGRRYNINVFALNGTRVVTIPLIGSPTGVSVQSISWLRGNAILVAASPHGFKVGATVAITVDGCAPDAFNGLVEALAVDPVTLTYPLASNPGQATALGTASRNISMTAGYFNSTIVYRAANGQFEVSP